MMAATRVRAVVLVAGLVAPALAAGASDEAGAEAALHHEIRLRLEPQSAELTADDAITIAPGGPIEIGLALRYRVDAATVDGRDAADATRGSLRIWRFPAASRARTFVVRWRGRIAVTDASIDHRATLGRIEASASPRGSFLPASAAWYPSAPGRLETYRVELDLPDDQRALVPGRLVDERVERGRYVARFDFPQPVEGIDAMAGPYRVDERTMSASGGRAIRLRTYFHPEIAALAGGYLDDVERYIRLYERRIGDYPFSGFSVVSSPTPTGFGMPSLTYLGVEVLRLPFIRATSLGHEVLHNWWGNGVYPRFEAGNWSEGLTTFMADYAYKEQEGADAAREMRLAWLTDIAAVPVGQDRPLRRFTSRTHGTSQVVGYNKSAMLFLMLRDAIGEASFDRALRALWETRRFRRADWDDLRHAFERESGGDLGRFFGQWLDRQGAPDLRLVDVRRIGDGRLSVTLSQAAPAYLLRVPLAIETEGAIETRVVEMSSQQQTFEVATAARPLAVRLDPDLRVLRRLAPGEAPRVLRHAMLDPGTRLLVLTAAWDSPARSLAASMLDHPVRDAERSALGNSPILAIGQRDDVRRWLAERAAALPPEVGGGGTGRAWIAPGASGPPLAVVEANDLAALQALSRPLPHLGRQSWAVFEGGRSVARGSWKSEPQRLVAR